ncbi:hypothetical protein AMAG_17237 [Allomyces macrogynus ATCC 38327]|uniref:Metallo-beta-lactamase domain-containing protein n=1 Tax=Allomyces macrogynus (strain ATCC 38327) TaxID=578462 RepID=A0A0L0TDZ5_ALLM3|nr:hypothetical protein AMAG_17237 [Allomyces macrogynus ATCC 38327]|eukprot:KNE73083.1 hypothetical protein AMAG_17237 [Allomyces macrogynus ATCC 38327]
MEEEGKKRGREAGHHGDARKRLEMEPVAEIWQLQANKGDAAVVRFRPHDKMAQTEFTMVIDTGLTEPDFRRVLDLAEKEKLVINLVVISHGDEDHYGGMTKTFMNTWLGKKPDPETAELITTLFDQAYFIVNWYGAKLKAVDPNESTSTATKASAVSGLIARLTELFPNRVMDTRQFTPPSAKKASVWYPPQGFLAGIDLYQLFCMQGVADVFRLYNECYACPLNEEAHDKLLAHSRRFKLAGPVKVHDAKKDPAATWMSIETMLNACRFQQSGSRTAEVLCVAFQEHYFDGTTRAPIPQTSGVSKTNRGSVGLLIRAGKFNFLTMGDLGYRGEIRVVKSLTNLLPPNHQLVVHKINHHGSCHSTIDPRETTTHLSLFSESAFKPRIILTSHGLQATPVHPHPGVTSAIMRHLDTEPSVALFTNRAPMGVVTANHARVVTTGAQDANLGLDTFRSRLIDYLFDVSPTLEAEGQVHFAELNKNDYSKQPGVHVRVSGAQFDTVLVEFYRNPRLRHAAIDPHRVVTFDMTTGHAAPVALPWLDLAPFVPVFAAVAGVNAAVGVGGTLVIDHPARGVGDFAIRFGHAVMQLDQLRVEAQRVADGVEVMAFDARFQIGGNGPSLRMRLDKAARYTNAAHMHSVTLVEADSPNPTLVTALLRDHELFQSLSARFPRLWSRVQDNVKEAHVSLQFLPLAFDAVGPPVPTLFVELVCRFDGFANDLVLQLSTEFLPCPRDSHGRHRSLPMWSIKVVGALDLVGDMHNDPSAPQKLGFCAVVQGRGDMEAHLVPPRNWSIEQLAATLTGLDFLGVVKDVVPGTVTLRDVWAKMSFDLRAQVSRKDLQEVGATISLLPTRLPDCLASLGRYRFDGRVTARPKANQWRLATVSLALVEDKPDCVLNLPDCPIQGPGAGLRLQSIAIEAHLFISPVVSVRFAVVGDLTMAGVEDAPVAVRECVGEIWLCKGSNGWTLAGGALSATITLGIGHLARADLRLDRSDGTTNWTVAIQIMCDEGQRPQIALTSETKQLPLALPQLAEDQSDALVRAPGFQLWSADMELNLLKSASGGSWTVYGHGELVVAFSTTVSLPGGAKMFDLNGVVAARVVVPLDEPREAGFASDVAVTWGSLPAQARVLARVDWIDGIETRIGLGLQGFNLHRVAPDWLRAVVPDSNLAIQFAYRSQHATDRSGPATTQYAMVVAIENVHKSWIRGQSFTLQITTESQGPWMLEAKFDGLDLARLVADSSNSSVVVTNSRLSMRSESGTQEYQVQGTITLKGVQFSVHANLARANGRVTAWALAGHARVPLNALAKLFPWLQLSRLDGTVIDVLVARAVNQLQLPDAPGSRRFGLASLQGHDSQLARSVKNLVQPTADSFTVQLSVNDLDFLHSSLKGVEATLFVTRVSENTVASTTIGLAVTKGSAKTMYGGSFFERHQLAFVGVANFGQGRTEFQLIGTASQPVEITILDVVTGITGIRVEHPAADALLNSIGIRLAAVALASGADGLRLVTDTEVFVGQTCIPLVVMLNKSDHTALGIRIACFPARPVNCVSLVEGLIADLTWISAFIRFRILWLDLRRDWRAPLGDFDVVLRGKAEWAPRDYDLGRVQSANGWTVSAGIRLELGEHWAGIGLAGLGIDGIVAVDRHGKVEVLVKLPPFNFAALDFDSNEFFVSPTEVGASVSATICTPSSQPWARFEGRILVRRPPALRGSLMLLPPRLSNVHAEDWIDVGKLDPNLSGLYIGGILADIDTSVSVPRLTAAGSLMVRHPALKRETTFSIAIQLPPIAFFYCSVTHVSLLTILAMFIKDDNVLKKLGWMETFLPVLEGLACFLKPDLTAQIPRTVFFCDWRLFGARGHVMCAAIGSNLASLAVRLDVRIEPIQIRLFEGAAPILTLCGVSPTTTALDPTRDLFIWFDLDMAKGTLELDAEVGICVSLFVTTSVIGRVQFRMNDKGAPSLLVVVRFSIGSSRYAIALQGSFFCRFAKLPLPRNDVGKAIEDWAPALKLAMVPVGVAMDLAIWGEKTLPDGTPDKADLIECLVMALSDAFGSLMRCAEEALDEAARKLREQGDTPIIGWLFTVGAAVVQAASALVSAIRKGIDLVASFVAKLTAAVIQIRDLHIGGALGVDSGLVAYINFDLTLFGHDIKGSLRVEIGPNFFQTLAMHLASLLTIQQGSGGGDGGGGGGGDGGSKQLDDYNAGMDENGNETESEGGSISKPESFELEPIVDAKRAEMEQWADRIEEKLAELAQALHERADSMPDTVPLELQHDINRTGANPREQLLELGTPGDTGVPLAADHGGQASGDGGDVGNNSSAPASGGSGPMDAPKPPKLKETEQRCVACPQCGRVVPDGAFDRHWPLCRPFSRCNVAGCDKLLRVSKNQHGHQHDYVDCPSCGSRQLRSRLALHLQAECRAFLIVPANGSNAWLLAWRANEADHDAEIKVILAPPSSPATRHILADRSKGPTKAGSASTEACPFGCQFSWSTWRELEAHLAACPLARCKFMSLQHEADHLSRHCPHNLVPCPIEGCGKTCLKRDEWMHFKEVHPQPLDEIDPNAKGPLRGPDIEYGSALAKAPSQYLAALTDTEVPELSDLSLVQLATEAVALHEDMETEYQCRAYCGQQCTSSEDEEWHVRNECELYRAACPLCEKTVVFKDLDYHQSTECPRALGRCPRPNCSSPVVPRYLLGQHMAHECDQAPAVCFFCPARVARSELGHHVFTHHDTQAKTPGAPIACPQPGCGQAIDNGRNYLVHQFTACLTVRRCARAECQATMPANQVGQHWASVCEVRIDDLCCPMHRDLRFASLTEWLSHRINTCSGVNSVSRQHGPVRLDPAPLKTNMRCPLQCGATVMLGDFFDHLAVDVRGAPPCPEFDIQEQCLNAPCQATFRRSHRAHHLAHECDFEMETCKMCGDQYVAKNLEQHWTVCRSCKPLRVTSQPYVPEELRRFPHLLGDVQLIWDGRPLVADAQFSQPHPHLRGVHLVAIDPIAHPGGNWTFETQHWCIDTCGAHGPHVPWTVRNGASDPVNCPSTTIAGLLQRLTSRDAPPFRVIAMAVFDDASLRMLDADQQALTDAQLLTVKLQFRQSWAAVIQMRPGLNGCEVVAFPHVATAGQGSVPVAVDVKVPWT